MTGVVLGIITALLWGSADILSSLAARYVGAWRVTLLAQASGCLALAGGGLFLSWRFPQEHFFTALPSPLFGVLVLHAIVLGALAAGGYVALYRSLAQGPLALVSPIIAANGAVTLLAAILFAREQVDLEEGLVLAVILLGVVLAALQTDDRQHKASLLTRSGIGWALMAMMGLGLLGFGIGASTHTVNAFFLLLCTRCWTLLFLDLAAHAFRPQAFAPPLRLKHLVLIGGAGVLQSRRAGSDHRDRRCTGISEYPTPPRVWCAGVSRTPGQAVAGCPLDCRRTCGAVLALHTQDPGSPKHAAHTPAGKTVVDDSPAMPPDACTPHEIGRPYTGVHAVCAVGSRSTACAAGGSDEYALGAGNKGRQCPWDNLCYDSGSHGLSHTSCLDIRWSSWEPERLQ